MITTEYVISTVPFTPILLKVITQNQMITNLFSQSYPKSVLSSFILMSCTCTSEPVFYCVHFLINTQGSPLGLCDLVIANPVEATLDPPPLNALPENGEDPPALPNVLVFWVPNKLPVARNIK